MAHMASMTMGMPSTSTASGAMSTSFSGMSGMPGMEGMDLSCKISMLWNWDTIDACFLASSWHITSHGMFAGSCIGTVCLVLCLEFLRRVGREYDAFILRRARLRRMYLSGSISDVSSKPRTENKNCPSVNFVEENNPKTTDCNRCCKVPPYSSAEDDLIAPAPVSSEQSSTTQKQTASVDTVKGRLSINVASQADRAEPTAKEPYRPSPVEQVTRALLHMLQFAVAYIIMLLAMYFNGYIIICIFVGAFLGSLIFSWEPVSLNKENDATQVTKCCG